jgi:hypothetical protein
MRFWARKVILLTEAEGEQLQQVGRRPLGTDSWAKEDWARWQRLLDADLVSVVDVEGDFNTSHLLMLTPLGEAMVGAMS